MSLYSTPPSPVNVLYVPEPAYPDFMPPKDEVLLAEEQPLPAALLPTADLTGYVPESDPEEDLEEDDNEDPEEDPADYLADGGDDGDDDDDSSDDDEDDDVDIKEDDEEEEHLAPGDSTAVALPVVDHAPSAEETEPFETNESAATPPPHPPSESPYLPVLFIGTSQSRQHNKSESEKDITPKDRKQRKNDKTRHGMEKL
ncbi:hypothetical protein Tco_1310166 [Tanacetum coccineum]